MSSHRVLLRAARLEYALLRAPLYVVETKVVRRYLAEDSAVRQNFERTLRFVDDLADSWLFDTRAPEPDQNPFADEPDDVDDTNNTDGADDTDDTDGAGATDEVDDEVAEERIHDLADELDEQEQIGQHTGELAENEDLRRVQAELHARTLIEEQQEHDR